MLEVSLTCKKSEKLHMRLVKGRELKGYSGDTKFSHFCTQFTFVIAKVHFTIADNMFLAMCDDMCDISLCVQVR